MIKEVIAKMFLAEERGFNDAGWFSSYNTFNFGKYQQAHKQPLGDLYIWNDDELAGGASYSMMVEEASFIILLPIAGAVTYKDTNGTETLVAAGQVQVTALSKDSVATFTNPFPEHAVNFLQVWMKNSSDNGNTLFYNHTFDTINDNINSFVPLVSGSTMNEFPASLSIARFSGRGEAVYQTTLSKADLFLFVLEGAFEVEGRLLHPRDGLALSNTDSIELEALSDNAIILLVEQ